MTRANTRYMPNWDIPGYDHLSAPGITTTFDCQRACDADLICRAWTFVSTRQVNDNCFLKTGIPHLEADSSMTSGVKQDDRDQRQLVWVYFNRSLSQQNPSASRTSIAGTIWLQLQTINDNWSLGLNIFIDHSIIEVFEPKGGRLAMTTRVYPEEDSARYFAVYVNEGPTNNEFIVLDTLDIWNLTSIW